MTWPGPQLLSRGKRMKRKDQGWSWSGRGKGETPWLHYPGPQEAPLVPVSTPLPWPPKIPPPILPLALVAPFDPLDLFPLDRLYKVGQCLGPNPNKPIL